MDFNRETKSEKNPVCLPDGQRSMTGEETCDGRAARVSRETKDKKKKKRKFFLKNEAQRAAPAVSQKFFRCGML